MRRAMIFAVYLTAVLLPGGCSVLFRSEVWGALPAAIEENWFHARHVVWLALNVAGFVSAIIFSVRAGVVISSRELRVEGEVAYVFWALAAIFGALLFLVSFSMIPFV